MVVKGRQTYGMKVPAHKNALDIELMAYLQAGAAERTGAVKPEGMGMASEHLIRAWKMDLPEPSYRWNVWSEYRAKLWCGDYAPKGKKNYITILGPSSTGKSTDLAILARLDWRADPLNTRTAVCSTTLSMLDERIWGEVVRTHNNSKYPHGKLKARIITDENVKDPISGIKGIAVRQYSNHQDALGKIVGAHLARNVIIVDEKQSMPAKLIADAYVNLSGSGEFKAIEMGNPFNHFDPLCAPAEPVKGWKSVDPDNPDPANFIVCDVENGVLIWETRRGVAAFFDGRKSPGMKDPERYPFYLTQAKHDETLMQYGPDSVQYRQQRVGFPLGEQVGKYVVTENECINGHVTSSAIWKDKPLTCACFDPAFATDGDRGIYFVFDVGVDVNDRTLIDFRGKYTNIGVDARKKMSVSDQIAQRIKLENDKEKVPIERFSQDATAMTAGYADAVEKMLRGENGTGSILRIKFQESASDKPVSERDQTPANVAYTNRVTELWMTAAEFIKADQIRGLPADAITELCSRRLEDKPQYLKKPKVESKRDMKTRMGFSPDIADSIVVGLALVRERLGIYPGIPGPSDGKIENAGTSEWMREFDTNPDTAYRDSDFDINPFLL